MLPARSRGRRAGRLAAGIALGAALHPTLPSAAAAADPVAGSVSFEVEVAVGPAFVEFVCAAGPCPLGTGSFVQFGRPTGSFTPYAGDAGLVQAIRYAAHPVGSPFLLRDFLTFSSTPGNPSPADIALDLEAVVAGRFGQADCTAPATVGQFCTPAFADLATPANPGGISPYNFTNASRNSRLFDLQLRGTARRVSTGERSPFVASLGAGAVGAYQSDWVGPLLAGQAFRTRASLSVTVTPAVVPEPGSGVLVLSALVVGAAASCRRGARH